MRGIRPRLSRGFTDTALGAVRFKLYRLGHVRSILTTGLDLQPLPQLVSAAPPVEHENIRGADYYAAPGAEEVAG